jgi:hypothetical protein
MGEVVTINRPIDLGIHPGTNARLVLPERKEPLVPSALPPSPELVKNLRRAGKVTTFALLGFGAYKLAKKGLTT